MRGFMGSRWRIGDGEFVVPLACDLAIAPAHRDRGVLNLIMTAAIGDLEKLGYRYVFSLSAEKITHIASLAAGWRAVGSPVLAQRVSRALGLRRYWADRLGPFTTVYRRAKNRVRFRWRAPAHPFAHLDQAPGRHPHPRVSLARAPRSEEMARQFRTTLRDGRIRQVRDAVFLDWRYSNPRSTYRFLFWEDSELRGYVVLAARLSYSGERYYPTVRIADWEASDREAESELLDAAMRWGRFSGVETWSATLSERRQRLLALHGLRVSTERPSFHDPGVSLLVRPTGRQVSASAWTGAGVDLLDIGNWDLRRIDADDT
jgi:hypothetical protein